MQATGTYTIRQHLNRPLTACATIPNDLAPPNNAGRENGLGSPASRKVRTRKVGQETRKVTRRVTDRKITMTIDLLALTTAGTEPFIWTDETVSRYGWGTLLRASRQGFRHHGTI